jgi:hypothetical protein
MLLYVTNAVGDCAASAFPLEFRGDVLWKVGAVIQTRARGAPDVRYDRIDQYT